MRQGRKADELRPVTITPAVAKFAAGSARIEFGDTHVFCTASLSDGVPGWLRGSGSGWVTAEYSMLPGATPRHRPRGRARQEMAAPWRSSASSAAVCAPSSTSDHRRTHDHRRLRRAAGRRRHAHGEHHWRLRGRVGRAQDQEPGPRIIRFSITSPPSPSEWWKASCARPRLRGGLGRRGRPQRGHHRRRPPRRGPGHGEGEPYSRAALEGDARPRLGRRSTRWPAARRPPARSWRRPRCASSSPPATATRPRSSAPSWRRAAWTSCRPAWSCRRRASSRSRRTPSARPRGWRGRSRPTRAARAARPAAGRAGALPRRLLRPRGRGPGWAPGVTSARYAGVDGPGADSANYEAPAARAARLRRPASRAGPLRLLGCRRRARHDTLRRNGILVGRHR